MTWLVLKKTRVTMRLDCAFKNKIKSNINILVIHTNVNGGSLYFLTLIVVYQASEGLLPSFLPAFRKVGYGLKSIIDMSISLGRMRLGGGTVHWKPE